MPHNCNIGYNYGTVSPTPLPLTTFSSPCPFSIAPPKSLTTRSLIRNHAIPTAAAHISLASSEDGGEGSHLARGG